MQPDPSWSSWSVYAKAGAEAARANDLETFRGACKSCHVEWRKKYQKAIPAAPPTVSDHADALRAFR